MIIYENGLQLKGQTVCLFFIFYYR